ncbi:hypothetical protein Tco_0079802 [Tanacetum coccineum]
MLQQRSTLRAKHDDLRYHFINEHAENKKVELYFVWTEYQLADISTKTLPRERFNFLIEKLDMRSTSQETLKRLCDAFYELVNFVLSTLHHICSLDVYHSDCHCSSLFVLEKLLGMVPSAERVKISSTIIRLETTMPQKEETFQVIIEPTRSVAEVFRTILNIYPRVEGEDFTDVLDDETALTFLIDLGYKGPLSRPGHTNIFIPPKKSRGKGSKGKKTVEESQETIDVSEESKPEPEPATKKTSGKRRVKKKVKLSADDNIISDDLDVALELVKFISQTKAEAARKVHATHARIVTESVPESAKKKSSGRSSKSVVIQEAPTLKESKKTSGRQPGTRGSNEGTGSKPGVPDESIVISATSSEGTGAKPGVPDEDKDITEEKVILEWGDEQDSEFSDDHNDDYEKDDKDGDVNDEGDDHVSDTQDADDDDDETESDKDEIYKYKIRLRNEEDVEMKDAEVEETDKGEEKVTDVAKEEAKKTSEAKDDTKKSELPPSSSILSDSTDADVNSLLDIPIQYETPQTQSPSIQKIPVDVSLLIPETTNLPPIPEIVTETPVSTAVPSPQVTPIFSSVQQTPTLIPTPPITTDAPTVTIAVPKSNALTAVELRVSKLEKDVSELKIVDHSSKALAVLQSQVPTVVDSYLDTKVGDVFQKELQKHTADLIHKYSLQHLPELTKKPTPTAE